MNITRHITRARFTAGFIGLLALTLALPGASQANPGTSVKMPRLVKDPTGKTPLKVPVGWKVDVQQSAQGMAVQVAERPGSPSSPMLGLISLPQSKGIAPRQLMTKLASAVSNRRLLRQANFPSGRAVLVQGTVGKIPAKMAIIGLTDANRAVHVVFFVAPTRRFDQLGGVRLLMAMVQMQINPFQKARPARPKLDLSYEGQMALLRAKIRSAPSAIIGTWSNGVSVPMSVYRDALRGGLATSSIGRGNHLEFRRNGTYVFLRTYSQSFQSCRNSRMVVVEHGRYRYDGWTLVLAPTKMEGAVRMCGGKPTRWKKHRTPRRTYEVAIHPSGQGLVIQGDCPASYPLGCVGSPGQRVLREGLRRK